MFLSHTFSKKIQLKLCPVRFTWQLLYKLEELVHTNVLMHTLVAAVPYILLDFCVCMYIYLLVYFCKSFYYCHFWWVMYSNIKLNLNYYYCPHDTPLGIEIMISCSEFFCIT